MTGDVKPWGIFATFALGAVALLAGHRVGAQRCMAPIWARCPTSAGRGRDVLFFVSAPVQVGLLIVAAAYKGDAAAYLGYKWPRLSEVVFSVAALVAVLVVGDTVSWLAGRDIVDRFQSDIYQAAKSANLLLLLLVAITVFIPITEESLFRGFLFRGWLRTPNHAWPVIAITAGLFAVIHVQYDWFLMCQVFAFGVLFGWIRWATGSTILTMLSTVWSI